MVRIKESNGSVPSPPTTTSLEMGPPPSAIGLAPHKPSQPPIYEDNRLSTWCLGLATVFFLLSTVTLLAMVVVLKNGFDNSTTLPHESAPTAAGFSPPPQQTTAGSSSSPTKRENAASAGSGDEGISPSSPPPSAVKWPEPSGSMLTKFRRGTVVADQGACSEAARDVLVEGGNAIEAAITSLLCVGVTNPQSSGLGGGFMLTVYNSTSGRCSTLNARETAPGAAKEDMFVGSPHDAIVGYAASAVPGELHGYWTAFKRWGSGRVSWARLFEPAIRLARHGFPVTANLASLLVRYEHVVLDQPSLRALFLHPTSNRLFREGDIMTRETLANTLQEIANSSDPVELFYRGGMAQTIVGEFNENKGILTAADLDSYRSVVDDVPIEVPLGRGLWACGPTPPGSFVLTQAIVRAFFEFYGKPNQTTPLSRDDPLLYHRLIEVEKFAYASRTRLGDVHFSPEWPEILANLTHRDHGKWLAERVRDTAQPIEYYGGKLENQPSDHGTSHSSVIDDYGLAVAVTSTVNYYFGSQRVSPTLGIIWNDEMDDFSTPGLINSFGFAPSEANYIRPGKRPMSSMSPTVVFDKATGKVRMAIGAAGGSYIISATAQAIIRVLLLGETAKEAVDAPRVHNQFVPHSTEVEKSFPQAIRDVLVERFGQNLTETEIQKSVVQLVERNADGFLYATADFRRNTATFPSGY